MLFSRANRLRFRRRMRMRQHQVEDLGVQAEQQIESLFLKRLERLVPVGRFVVVWSLLVVLLVGVTIIQIQGLSKYHQFVRPVPGGVLNEGIVGAFTTANPLYATGSVDAAVSRLVFSGLLTYDQQNRLTGDLAESWAVDKTDTVYTVRLRDNLFWHDGTRLTADDVAFTFQLIQNPDAQSPLASAWQDIVVKAKSTREVEFKLPSSLGAFPHSLTTGIVPKHLLQGIPAASLRSASFNTVEPIGAGPFAWKTLEVEGGTPETREERIALVAFKDYYGGRVKLDGIVIRSFRSEDRMVKSFKSQRIQSMAGLSEAPALLQDEDNVVVRRLPYTAATFAFLKTSHPVLANAAVRNALVRATDKAVVADSLPYPAVVVTQPLLRNQLGYNPTLGQASYDLAGAQKMLEADGWKVRVDGVRAKGDQKLAFSVYAKKMPEYARVTQLLAEQWTKIGVKLTVFLQDESEFHNTVSNHSYDVLLSAISVGADPDVYAFWSSTQADVRSASRLNFAEYKSGAADISLEAGRAASDPALRNAKYQPFLKAWQKDSPAVGLYQPQALYISRGQIYGLREHPLNTEADRFNNAAEWMIRAARSDDK